MKDNAKTWFAIDVVVKRAAAEAIESAFNQLDSLGTEIDDIRRESSPTVCVTGYFEVSPPQTDIDDAVADTLAAYRLSRDVIKSVSRRTVGDTDWLLEWKRHWRPTEVGGFVIAPPWSEVEETDKIVIRIEPNMAFGTGTHETTQLCIKAIEKYMGKGMSFLDVGTGTGVLAIAVAKLQPKSAITACDVDADSVRIAKENAAANGVADRVEFYEGSITDATPVFDFICANLTLDVIVPLLSLLADKSKYHLLLSGILAEQKRAILAELLKRNIITFSIQHAGEWISVLITR